MNETEESVVKILASHPRSDTPWVEPMQALAKRMKWPTDKTRRYVEYLMHRKYLVLKSDGMQTEGEAEPRGYFWWERGKAG
jgi:hypothetical protein